VLGFFGLPQHEPLKHTALPAPWGVYSFPGLLLVFTGLLSAGVVTARVDAYRVLGRLLTSISLLYFTGGFSAMLFYNLLGRDDSANKLASSNS
jgi:hypothetical protein